MESLNKHFSIAPHAEITLEANPDDVTEVLLKGWKSAGINRISMGVQSFYEEELLWMNRAHNSLQADESIAIVFKHFDNLTIDLIYGSPLLTDEMWEQNVSKALAYGIPHLSCYALTVEEKTPLFKHINQQKKAPVDSDRQAHQFLLLMQWLRTAGYEHYEVSNFAKPGFRSRHNSSYWRGEKYLGLGPSAHSYNGTDRQWNVANNQQYIRSINEHKIPAEKESLTARDRLNETIMISLRTKEGLNLEYVEKVWGNEQRTQLEKDLKQFVDQNLVQQNGTTYSLTDHGMLRADGIAAALFS
jgi:oxygen-independent coproporphyrinogen-3 oxidase